MVLRQSEKAFPTEAGKTSEFGILRNRLLEFLEDVNAEAADQDLLLSREEQQEALTFLRRFFRERVDPEGEKNFNRFLHYLAQDPVLWEDFEGELRGWHSGSEAELERYRTWSFSYLYRDLKASAALTARETTGGFQPTERQS